MKHQLGALQHSRSGRIALLAAGVGLLVAITIGLLPLPAHAATATHVTVHPAPPANGWDLVIGGIAGLAMLTMACGVLVYAARTRRSS